eukprot:3879672-Pleurochrysis_carterae.AAC.2
MNAKVQNAKRECRSHSLAQSNLSSVLHSRSGFIYWRNTRVLATIWWQFKRCLKADQTDA